MLRRSRAIPPVACNCGGLCNDRSGRCAEAWLWVRSGARGMRCPYAGARRAERAAGRWGSDAASRVGATRALRRPCNSSAGARDASEGSPQRRSERERARVHADFFERSLLFKRITSSRNCSSNNNTARRAAALWESESESECSGAGRERSPLVARVARSVRHVLRGI